MALAQHHVSWLFFLVVGLIPLDLAGQEAFPKALDGRWSATTPQGQLLGNTWSVLIEKQNPDGSFEGKVTYYGVFCGTRNQPMTGKFDGAGLSIITVLEPQKPFAECGKASFTLKKKGGRNLFEGQLEIERIPVKADVYLNPS